MLEHKDKKVPIKHFSTSQVLECLFETPQKVLKKHKTSPRLAHIWRLRWKWTYLLALWSQRTLLQIFQSTGTAVPSPDWTSPPLPDLEAGPKRTTSQ